MPQPRTSTTITGNPGTASMTMGRRTRIRRKRTITKPSSGIKFTTRQGNNEDFGTFVSSVLDQYRVRPTGHDLALTISLVKEVWDAAGGR